VNFEFVYLFVTF